MGTPPHRPRPACPRPVGPPTRRARLLAGAAVAAAALGLAPLSGAAGSAARAPAPVVHLALTPVRLSGEGGRVVAHLRVRGATRCRLTAPAGVVVAAGWVPCRSGVGQLVAEVGANRTPAPVRLHVTAWASGPGGTAGVVAFFLLGPRATRATPPPTGSATPSGTAPVAQVPAAPSATPAGSASTAPASPVPLSITTASLPAATEGVPYRAVLRASGGTPPYAWAIGAGALPPGLSLAADGTVSGTPQATGNVTVQVTVTDAAAPRPATATEALTIAVGAPPFVGQASTNWSGYVVDSPGPLLTEASGEWTVPALDCTATPNAGLATWVGIGGARGSSGASSGVLLQTGVTTDCANGLQMSTGWWEEYPSDPNNEVPFAGLNLAPGDRVRASVYQAAGGAWVTRLDDLTTGVSGVMVTGTGWGVALDGTGTYSSEGSTAGLSYAGGTSAEWIAEDYQRAGTLVPLADFGTLAFQSLTTSLSSWSLVPTEAVEMDQGGALLAVPSPPATDGFTVSFLGAGTALAGSFLGAGTALVGG